jgi:hypothetical protein
VFVPSDEFGSIYRCLLCDHSGSFMPKAGRVVAHRYTQERYHCPQIDTLWSVEYHADPTDLPLDCDWPERNQRVRNAGERDARERAEDRWQLPDD